MSTGTRDCSCFPSWQPRGSLCRKSPISWSRSSFSEIWQFLLPLEAKGCPLQSLLHQINISRPGSEPLTGASAQAVEICRLFWMQRNLHCVLKIHASCFGVMIQSPWTSFALVIFTYKVTIFPISYVYYLESMKEWCILIIFVIDVIDFSTFGSQNRWYFTIYFFSLWDFFIVV